MIEAAPRATTIGDLFALAAGPTAAFVDALAPWLLIGPAMKDDGDEWSFRTTSLNTVSLGDSPIMLEPSFVVLPIMKARPGPFADTVLLGRSSSNDIAIPDSSISKLHARLKLRGDDVVLTDAGSSNGTKVDDRALGPATEIALTDGALVTLGDRAYTALRAATLHHLVKKLAGLA